MCSWLPPPTRSKMNELSGAVYACTCVCLRASKKQPRFSSARSVLCIGLASCTCRRVFAFLRCSSLPCGSGLARLCHLCGCEWRVYASRPRNRGAAHTARGPLLPPHPTGRTLEFGINAGGKWLMGRSKIDVKHCGVVRLLRLRCDRFGGHYLLPFVFLCKFV
jgi:hypothetical protein